MKRAQKFLGKSALKFGNEFILPGERRRIQIEVASLFDYTKLNIPVEVIRGKEPGPILFISAAIHGDEINGVEIIKRLLQRPQLNRIKGTLIVIPIVNVFGFNSKSRYLPDRRDLNRCFPGSSRGSLGARLADIFMKEIVTKCTHGIDLHTGSIHRSNLPHIRACLDDPETFRLAEGFGVPVMIHSQLRDGSLREAARKRNVITLLFEGGEALRFEEDIVKAGLKGCVSVMRNIGMLPKLVAHHAASHKKMAFTANESYWVRANHSGSFRLHKKLGDHVADGEVLATISDPFGDAPYDVKAKGSGIIIGLSTIPLVNNGDAIIHIATFKNSKKVRKAIEQIDESNLKPY
ncbi:MAG: succinylglutamate desuccinylase/aspartoacylase family protein [Bdellovibrionales bacterium]|nr:succinylglutamate desuccinylase/aspartoacylase family protein [Bdellovibrionales bacterium]